MIGYCRFCLSLGPSDQSLKKEYFVFCSLDKLRVLLGYSLSLPEALVSMATDTQVRDNSSVHVTEKQQKKR
jgi:hypothetical protein